MRERLGGRHAELARAERLGAAGHHHRALHLAEVVVGAVGGAALVEAGLVVGAAGEVHGAVLAGHQPVADVGVEGVGAGDVERRLRGEVGEGRLVGGERRASPAGALGERVVALRRRGSHRPAGRSARRARARRRCPGAPARRAAARPRPSSGRRRAARPGSTSRSSTTASRSSRIGLPRQRGAGRHHGGAVGAEVDGPALEAVAEGGRHRLPHGAVEAGGVAEERGAAVAAVLVHGQRDTVGGGHRAHRCILVGRRRARRIASGRCPIQPPTRSTRATPRSRRRCGRRTGASTTPSRPVTSTPCPTCGPTTTACRAPIRAGGRSTAGAPCPARGSRSSAVRSRCSSSSPTSTSRWKATRPG